MDGGARRISTLPGAGTVGIGFEPDAGAAPVSAPEDTAWGERMAQVRDPDGNLLYLAVAST